MATIDIGNYRYNTDGSVKVIDITLDYNPEEPIESTFEINGVNYQVTSMSGCFYACSNLTIAPNIPETVIDMSGCFYGCSSLTQAPVIPSGVIDLSTCFYNCSSLTVSPVIPNTVIDMSGCFYGCYNLTSAPVIPNSVVSINSCFYRCYSLQTPPTIPNSITDMTYCFASCTSLTTAPTIPESITDLTFCFYNCSTLTIAPEIPNSVTNLYGCFYDCTSLTTVSEISASVINMDYCFYNCTSLTGTMTVYNIPTTYVNIFTETNNLTIATIGTTNTIYNTWNTIVSNYEYIILLDYISDESSINFNFGDYTYQAVVNGTKVTNTPAYDLSATARSKTKISYFALESTFYIGRREYNLVSLENCFLNCRNLTQAPSIPMGVINMESCFNGCNTLKRAPVIPSSVTNMNYCFASCTLLNEVPNISSGATSLVDCFFGCTSLTQVPAIPSSVTNMGECFSGCHALIQAPVIPSKVTNLRSCFESCYSLTQAPVIPSSVIDISACFYGCTSLIQAPKIPSSVTNADSCFKQCTALVGNIKIATTAINSESDSFTGTILPIYLINSTPTRDTTVTENLRAIAAADLDDNLHFEADETTITASAIVQRVKGLSSEIAGESTNALIKAIVETNNVLPEGWTNALIVNSLQMDDAAITSTWQKTSENLQPVYKTWYNTKDYKEHSFTLSVTGEVRDENGQSIRLIYINDIVFTLARAPGVPFSAYHDKENNTDGIAVGIIASKGKLFEVDWNAQFNQDVLLDGGLYLKLDVDADAGVDTDATSGANMELFNAIRQLGWYDSVIIK